MNTLTTNKNTRLYFTGPKRENGALPALFYFALSGKESLTLPPYNQPATSFNDLPVRVFSFDLPFHGDNFDKVEAMQHWAERFVAGEDFLSPFFDQVVEAISWLVEEGLVLAHPMAAVGLSRGGFIATHIAARVKRLHYLLGFAPLTRLHGTKEFIDLEIATDAFDLTHLSTELLHLKNLRFYIGNRDTRVHTDACYQFIRHMADTVYEHKARACEVELILTPSVGHQGHGTLPPIFDEGIQWLKNKMALL